MLRRRLPLAAALAACGVLVVGTIGPPLWRDGVFHGSAVLYNYAPWAEDRPVGYHWDGFPIEDTVASSIPNRAQFAERLRDGELDLWDPYPTGGSPLGSTPKSAIYSPLNLPYLLGPLDWAPALAKLLEMAAAIGFTFLFLRRLHLGRVAALTGGIVFAGSGFLVVWSNWDHPQAAALLAALFWSTERAIQLRTTRSVAVVALAMASLMLAHFPAVAFWGGLLLAGHAVVRLAPGLRAPPAQWWRRARVLAALGAGIVLGGLLVAFVALPFGAWLGSLDLGYRAQTSHNTLPFAALSTLFAPYALGTPMDGSYFGGRNWVETQSFVGAAAVVLAVLALARARPTRLPRGTRTYFAAAVAVMVVLVYVGGAPLALAQRLPVFHGNFIGRMRAVLGFALAVLAAVGVESLAHRVRPAQTRDRLRAVLVWGAAVLVGAIALQRAYAAAQDAGRTDYLLHHLVVPGVAGALALSLALVAPRLAGSGRSLLLGVVPVVVAVEALTLSVPSLPRSSRESFYPTTPTHRFLQEHLGDDRYVAVGTAMDPSATSMWDLRTVTGQERHAPTWQDLVLEVDPGAFRGSNTYSFIRQTSFPDSIESPVLDRMGVRYAVTPNWLRPPGTVRSLHRAPEGSVSLPAGGTTDVRVPATPLRAVLVDVPADEAVVRSTVPRLTVEVLGADGRRLAAADRRVDGPGTVLVPLAGEDLPTSGTLDVRLGLDADDGRLVLRGDDAGVALSGIVPADDTLDLVDAGGALVYERTTALPRVRWASHAEVVPDAARRRADLAAGVAPDTVVLSEPGPLGPLPGGTARVTITVDGDDRVVTTVDADAPGYLVVADAMQFGWRARVDGRRVDLVDADHAFVAVPVPAGRHEVVVAYVPPGRRKGVAVSLLALVAVAGLWAWPLVRRRRGGPDDQVAGGTDEGGTGADGAGRARSPAPDETAPAGDQPTATADTDASPGGPESSSRTS